MRHESIILIVDDDPDIREVFDAFLEQRGHRPIIAHEAVGAAALLRAAHPDLMIADVVLGSGGDGEGLAGLAQSLGVRVLLISGEPATIARWSGQRGRFLQKPFGLSVLDEAVETLLAQTDRPPATGGSASALEPEESRVREAEKRIARQRALIELLDSGALPGHAKAAKLLLATMEMSRRLARDALRARRAQDRPPPD